MDRVTDEWLAQVEANAELHDGFPDAYSGDLLKALKAEREHNKELFDMDTEVIEELQQDGRQLRARVVKLEAENERLRGRLPAVTMQAVCDTQRQQIKTLKARLSELVERLEGLDKVVLDRLPEHDYDRVEVHRRNAWPPSGWYESVGLKRIFRDELQSIIQEYKK